MRLFHRNKAQVDIYRFIRLIRSCALALLLFFLFSAFYSPCLFKTFLTVVVETTCSQSCSFSYFLGYSLLSPIRMLSSDADNPPLNFWIDCARVVRCVTIWLDKAPLCHLSRIRVSNDNKCCARPLHLYTPFDMLFVSSTSLKRCLLCWKVVSP